MSTVSSASNVTNPGIAELMQTLSGSGVSLFSSPAMASALQSAPPQDVAELSVAAVQMQGMDQLFGIADGTSQTPDSSDSYSAEMNGILANLDTTATTPNATDSSTSTSTAGTDSTASQLAQYQFYAQGAENQALLGGGSTFNALI